MKNYFNGIWKNNIHEEGKFKIKIIFINMSLEMSNYIIKKLKMEMII